MVVLHITLLCALASLACCLLGTLLGLLFGLYYYLQDGAAGGTDTHHYYNNHTVIYMLTHPTVEPSPPPFHFILFDLWDEAWAYLLQLLPLLLMGLLLWLLWRVLPLLK